MADRGVPGLRQHWTRAYAFITVSLLVLPLLLLVSPGSATVYTCDGKANATSVQDLINTTVNGDSIYLAGGRYSGNLQINRSIVFGALDTNEPPEILSTNSSEAGITLLTDSKAINVLIITGEADT